MHAEDVEAIAVDPLEELRAVSHEPNDEFAKGGDPGIHGSVFDVLRLAVFFEDKINLRVRERPRIDDAGAGARARSGARRDRQK